MNRIIIDNIDTPVPNLVDPNQVCLMESPTINRSKSSGEYSIQSTPKPWTLKIVIITALMFPAKESESNLTSFELAEDIFECDITTLDISESDLEHILHKMDLVHLNIPVMVWGHVVTKLKALQAMCESEEGTE